MYVHGEGALRQNGEIVGRTPRRDERVLLTVCFLGVLLWTQKKYHGECDVRIDVKLFHSI